MFAPSSFDTVGFDALSVSTLSAQVQPRVQALPYYPQQTGDIHLLPTVANGSSAASPNSVLQQRQPGEKNPALAGILSFFVPFGTGSFYAGNDGHGIRHLVFGGVTVIGTLAGIAVARDGGFDLCNENDGYAIAVIFAAGFLANQIWGTVAAIGDANAYNRQFRENALQFAPGVMLVETSAQRLTSGKRARAQRVGLRAVRVVF